MNLNVCIVEDSQIDSDLLNGILKEYFDEKHFKYSIKKYDTGVAFFADFEEGYICPTTLFIRIVLPNSNGLDICKKLRSLGFAGDIVFVTDKPEYAIDAFNVDARGFILKPYSAQHVHDVLDRVCSFALLQTLAIKMGRNFFRVPVFSIMYAESKDHDVILHCRNNTTYVTRNKLDHIEAEINSNKFLRCHKSFLVNMNYVKGVVGTDFVLSDDSTVPMRKQDYKVLRDAYEQFVEESR